MSVIAEHSHEVIIQCTDAKLTGELYLPAHSPCVVVFAHGSGSSRFSPRNQFVASRLQEAGIGTLLFDLLTAQEETRDIVTRHFRFNIDLLSKRLSEATQWLLRFPEMQDRKIAYFGSSTGAAAAIKAAAETPWPIGAIVSRGGRVDLAFEFLPQIHCPTLLIVGELDETVLRLNQLAYTQLISCVRALEIIPNATHLFDEPGALEDVADRAAHWFENHTVFNATIQK
jgi:putative phosphoribosyl transferase